MLYWNSLSYVTVTNHLSWLFWGLRYFPTRCSDSIISSPLTSWQDSPCLSRSSLCLHETLGSPINFWLVSPLKQSFIQYFWLGRPGIWYCVDTVKVPLHRLYSNLQWECIILKSLHGNMWDRGTTWDKYLLGILSLEKSIFSGSVLLIMSVC